MCSIEVLGLYSCIRIGANDLLKSDLRTPCPITQQGGFLFVWTVMSTVVYPFGIPLLMLWGLYYFEVPQMARWVIYHVDGTVFSTPSTFMRQMDISCGAALYSSSSLPICREKKEREALKAMLTKFQVRLCTNNVIIYIPNSSLSIKPGV